MNLQKYFSTQKIMSRREAEGFIRAGKVKVNGKIVSDLAFQVDADKDVIEVVGQMPQKTTVAVYKPRGITCTKAETEGKTIFDLLPQFKDLNCVGRLDKESEGLILLSDDGVLTRMIAGEDHLIEKEYVVNVREFVTQSKINALSKSMMLEDGPTLPAKAEQLGEHTFSIVLKEGRNHQIRRMANKVRLTITKLKRVRIGEITIAGLSTGQYRRLDAAEIASLKAV